MDQNETAKAGMERVLSARPSLAARAGFLLGSCPESLKNAAWDTFLLFYYTQVLGLSGKLTGLAIAVSLIDHGRSTEARKGVMLNATPAAE